MIGPFIDELIVCFGQIKARTALIHIILCLYLMFIYSDAVKGRQVVYKTK